MSEVHHRVGRDSDVVQLGSVPAQGTRSAYEAPILQTVRSDQGVVKCKSCGWKDKSRAVLDFPDHLVGMPGEAFSSAVGSGISLA